MSCPITFFYGGVVTPIDPRRWDVIPKCLLMVGPTGDIIWMSEDIEINIPGGEIMVQAPNGRCIAGFVFLREGEFIIPGFIDTHTHAPQYPNLGKGGQYELLDWLEKVTFPKEAQFKEEKYAKEVYPDVVRRSLDCGTTTSCYYGTLHLEATKILAKTANGLGQRAFVGKCNMDRKSDNLDYYVEKDAETSLEETRELIKYIRSLRSPALEPLVQPILTPRFAIACTSDLLEGLGDIAHQDSTIQIQTHISENPSEILRTLELYPKAKSYADVYDSHGLLRDTTILGHAVHLMDDEIELIKKRDAGVSHCPTSNFNLRSGVAPIGRYLDHGMKIGLGTDVSGGYAVSMLNVIRDASIASKILAVETPINPTRKERFINRQLPIPTLFYLATLGGAKVCNLSNKVGSFSVGKSFDALVVSVLEDTGAIGVWGKEAKLDPNAGAGDPEKRKKLEKEKLEENLERFLFCGDDRNILSVYVQGRHVGGRSFRK